ncbi:MAG: LytTR family DNA-binding domain-containing protein [Peptostreptococcaceae bacterium]|nr:LytTR family DNA-binding domain-containing protein [Peptostreptococcaceae bacterium]
MKIEVKIDDSCKEPKIIILTREMTDEIHALVNKLSDQKPEIIAGYRNETFEILDPSRIIRIYTASGKVFAVTKEGEYTLRLRLYELEEHLNRRSFVRISNSEIINLKKVRSFDLSFSGTICVKLSDETTSYVSRRYVAKIKQVLGV